MTAEDIKKLEALMQRAAALPKELLPGGEARVGSVDAAELSARTEIAQRLIREADDLTIEAGGCLSALFGSGAKYVEELASLKFDEPLLGRRPTPARVNPAWGAKREKLCEQLARAMAEGREKMRIKDRESSWREYLRSSTARGIVLTTLMGSVAGFFSKDLIAKWIDGVRWNKLGGAFPNFEIVDHERIVDLTEWTPTPKGDTNSLTGKSVFISNMKLRKIRDEGTQFCITAASSGSDPVFTSSTHKISQHPIEMKLVGWPNMPKQSLAALEIPPETLGNTIFNANINSIRYRGFSDEHAEWCSIGIWNPTRKLTLVVKFPAGKMGHDFQFKSAFFYDKNNFEIQRPDKAHLSVGSNSVTWSVEHPILGNAYRIDWNW